MATFILVIWFWDTKQSRCQNCWTEVKIPFTSCLKHTVSGAAGTVQLLKTSPDVHTGLSSSNALIKNQSHDGHMWIYCSYNDSVLIHSAWGEKCHPAGCHIHTKRCKAFNAKKKKRKIHSRISTDTESHSTSPENQKVRKISLLRKKQKGTISPRLSTPSTNSPQKCSARWVFIPKQVVNSHTQHCLKK